MSLCYVDYFEPTEIPCRLKRNFYPPTLQLLRILANVFAHNNNNQK